jgi:hypothetical protein
MNHITYRRIPAITGIKVENNLGAISHFGDFYAYALFIQGASRAHEGGVKVTVIDEEGRVIVGTVDQLDPPVAPNEEVIAAKWKANADRRHAEYAKRFR